MTEQQLEAAARKLCELRGLDPDQRVSHGAPPNNMGYVPAVLLYSPRWQMVAGEIRGFYQIAQALDSVLSGDLP